MSIPNTDNQKTPTALLFGDSHTVAIQKALQRREALGLPVPLVAFRRLKWKGEAQMGDIFFKDFLKRISTLGSNDVAVSMIGGSHYAMFSTIQHPRPFDFHSEDEPASACPGAEIIPYRALRSFFRESILEGVDTDELVMRGDGAMLEAMRRATRGRVLHLMPPPPLRNSDELMAGSEQFFADRDIGRLGVSPPELRLKFWSLQVRIVRKFCAKRGIDVLMPPVAAFEDGYLRPDLHARGAHANWRYGELMVGQLERILIKIRRKDSQAQNHLE
jgi:hypothetical protein